MRFSRFVPVAGLLLAAACSDSSTTAPAAPSLARGTTGGINSGTGVAALNGGLQAADVVVNAGPMIYHGGPIVPTMKVAAIYWATTTIYLGGPAPGTNGPGSADGSLLGHFMRNLGGSPYYNINTTYTDTVGGGRTVANTLTYSQYWADNTSVPPSTGSAVSNATIKAEIAKGFSTGKLTYDPNTIYAVFTKGKTNLGGGFGTSYCAYHGKFNINGQITLYAAMPFNNAYPAGCSSRQLSPNNDPAADREASTLAHEIEEANTDPQLNAWYDAAGQENADKCAYVYGTTYLTGNNGVANMNLGGKDFLIQQNWINIAGGGNCATQF